MPTKDDIIQKILDTVRPMIPENYSAEAADLNLVDDLGLDSVKVMEILEILEDNFDISIPLNILPDIRTVEDLAVEIQNLTRNE